MMAITGARIISYHVQISIGTSFRHLRLYFKDSFGDYQKLHLGQEVYLTSVNGNKQIRMKENAFSEYKHFFSCKCFALTLKPFQQSYLCFLEGFEGY